MTLCFFSSTEFYLFFINPFKLSLFSKMKKKTIKKNFLNSKKNSKWPLSENNFYL
jgi:hypothetical protein